MSNPESAAGAPDPNAEPTPDPESRADTPEDAQRQIAQTRERLGDTVQQLAQKADVKAQAQQRVQEGRDEVRARVDGVKEQALQLGGRVQEVTPERAQQAVGQLVGQVRAAPWAAAAALAGGLLLGRLLFGRRRG